MFERKAAAVVNPLARDEGFPPNRAQNTVERTTKPATNPPDKSGTHSEAGSKSEPPKQGKSTEPAGPSPLGKGALPLRVPPILFEADEPHPPAHLAAEPKFALGATSSPPGKEHEQAALPESYGTGRLWVVCRDPHCLYVRWDLTNVQQRHYSSLAAHHHLAIRVHLDSLPGTQVSEVQVPTDARHFFIQVAFAGRWYVAELGYYQANQEWKSIAVSERVATPPDSIAEDRIARFATFTPQFFRPPPSKPAPGFAQPSQPAASPLSAPPWTQSMRKSEHMAPGGEPAMPMGVSSIVPPAEIEFEPGYIPGEEWTPAQEEALADVIDWAVEWNEPVSSAEFVRVPQAQEVERISSLDVSIPGVPMAGQEISSPGGGGWFRPKGFWFGVNAELVIYGATDPSARVTIGGRPIQLRGDGTFSYRFALPDGRYQLPIEATSVEGEVRRAEMEFERGTRYQGEARDRPQDPHLKTPEPGNVS